MPSTLVFWGSVNGTLDEIRSRNGHGCGPKSFKDGNFDDRFPKIGILTYIARLVHSLTTRSEIKGTAMEQIKRQFGVIRDHVVLDGGLAAWCGIIVIAQHLAHHPEALAKVLTFLKISVMTLRAYQ